MKISLRSRPQKRTDEAYTLISTRTENDGMRALAYTWSETAIRTRKQGAWQKPYFPSADSMQLQRKMHSRRPLELRPILSNIAGSLQHPKPHLYTPSLEECPGTPGSIRRQGRDDFCIRERILPWGFQRLPPTARRQQYSRRLSCADQNRLPEGSEPTDTSPLHRRWNYDQEAAHPPRVFDLRGIAEACRDSIGESRSSRRFFIRVLFWIAIQWHPGIDVDRVRTEGDQTLLWFSQEKTGDAEALPLSSQAVEILNAQHEADPSRG